MYRYDPVEEASWEKVEPYLDGAKLRDDAPEEIKEAVEKLRELAWDPDRGQ